MRDFRCFVILLLTYTTLFKETQQSCSVEDFRQHEFNPYFRIVFKKYVHCQFTPLTSDFHKQVEKFFGNQEISWLEINETKSLEIAEGAFFSLKMLKDLRINSASVRVIEPHAFTGMLSLKMLSLKNNQIVKITENCFTLSNLEVLDLSFNSINSIEEESFVFLAKLESLYLNNNFIKNLPPLLFHNLKKLKELDLSFNQLSYLDNNLLKSLTALTKLSLNNNDLTSFSGNLLANNSRIETLYINNNNLQSLTDLTFSSTNSVINASHNLIQKMTFINISTLKVLDLSANELQVLKPEFFVNVTLQELHLSKNYLGLNPMSKNIFSDLSTLQILSLNNNLISNLDSSMFKNNTVLTVLDLSGNKLSQGKLNLPKSLKTLKLSSNKFDTRLNLTNLINLNSLDLGGNELETISYHFFDNLSQLRVLNLNDNKINKIYLGAFRNLKNLDELNLANNNISNLDLGVFVGTDTLSKLDLSHNHLSHLNEGIFHNLRFLRYLNLGYNNISFLDVENTLSHIGLLREINLAGNYWPCSFLTTIIRDFRSTRFVSGNDNNVTNVNGIACRYESKASNDTIDFQKNFNVIAAKLSTSNNLLICIVLILILGLILQYLPPYLKKRKLFPSVKNEQEIQLISNC